MKKAKIPPPKKTIFFGYISANVQLQYPSKSDRIYYEHHFPTNKQKVFI